MCVCEFSCQCMSTLFRPDLGKPLHYNHLLS